MIALAVVRVIIGSEFVYRAVTRISIPALIGYWLGALIAKLLGL